MMRYLLLLVFVMLSNLSFGQYNKEQKDSITIKTFLTKDSLHLSISTSYPRYQLSFLMQGLYVHVKKLTGDTLVYLSFPNASEVRGMIRHHPNEIKAMHHGDGEIEIRPDLQPLVFALNTIPAKVMMRDSVIRLCTHNIKIEKENGGLSFSVTIPTDTLLHPGDSVIVGLTSTSKQLKLVSEYDGRRLSRENRMPPHGLGSAPSIMNAIERDVRIQRRIKIP